MESSTPKIVVTLPMVTAETATEICERCALAADTLELLEEEMTPEAFLAVLLEHEIHADAVKFLSQALPKRTAVEWAERCARSAVGEAPAEFDAKCLQAIVDWLADPSEENRRAAMDLADEVGYSTPASSAAAAAGWSGGSMGPAEYDDVTPPENLTGTMVSSTALLAAYSAEPDKAAATLEAYLRDGIETSGGTIEADAGEAS